MRRLVAVALLLAGVAVAAPAQAATLTADQRCYREREPVKLVGAGFTPGGTVNISRDNFFVGAFRADGAGTIKGGGPAPLISPSRQRAFTLTATDATNPALSASVMPLASIFDVKVSPLGGNPARRRRINARGFTTGRTLYAHVRRKGRGRNIRLGRLKRPCGNKRTTKRFFRRSSKSGIYRVQFDTRRRYSRRTFPRVTYNVTVFQVLRPRRSAAAAFAGAERWARAR